MHIQGPLDYLFDKPREWYISDEAEAYFKREAEAYHRSLALVPLSGIPRFAPLHARIRLAQATGDGYTQVRLHCRLIWLLTYEALKFTQYRQLFHDSFITS